MARTGRPRTVGIQSRISLALDKTAEEKLKATAAVWNCSVCEAARRIITEYSEVAMNRQIRPDHVVRDGGVTYGIEIKVLKGRKPPVAVLDQLNYLRGLGFEPVLMYPHVVSCQIQNYADLCALQGRLVLAFRPATAEMLVRKVRVGLRAPSKGASGKVPYWALETPAGNTVYEGRDEDQVVILAVAADL